MTLTSGNLSQSSSSSSSSSMKCGIGKCGRCNVGSKYVCKDGPVFRCSELTELPQEF